MAALGTTGVRSSAAAARGCGCWSLQRGWQPHPARYATRPCRRPATSGARLPGLREAAAPPSRPGQRSGRHHRRPVGAAPAPRRPPRRQGCASGRPARSTPGGRRSTRCRAGADPPGRPEPGVDVATDEHEQATASQAGWHLPSPHRQGEPEPGRDASRWVTPTAASSVLASRVVAPIPVGNLVVRDSHVPVPPFDLLSCRRLVVPAAVMKAAPHPSIIAWHASHGNADPTAPPNYVQKIPVTGRDQPRSVEAARPTGGMTWSD